MNYFDIISALVTGLFTMNQFLVLALCCLALGISAQEEPSKVRITSNDLAREGEFPYQVSLQVDGQHICGGSLVSRRHVVTAAHCVYHLILYRTDKSRVKVRVGSTSTSGGTVMDVDRIARHGSYVHSEVRPTLVADIAVIRLKKPVTESSTVRVIQLPSPNQEVQDGTELIVSGFGTNVFMGPVSPVLKKMKMRAVGRQRCQQAWTPAMVIRASQMCALNAPGNGVCQGDSGGPLTLNKQVLIGVVSAVSGTGCGTGIPDLFTKVSHHLDFINNELALTS